MSIETMAIVLHHSAAKGTAKVVMLGIANHDGDGGAYPAVSTLAKYANVSKRSVQETLNALVEMGEITIVRNGGGQRDSRYRTNRYEVLVQCPVDCDKTKNHRSRDEAHRTPDRPGVKDGASRGEESRDPGVKPAAPEPSFEPPCEPSLFPGFVDEPPPAAQGKGKVDPLAVAKSIVNPWWEAQNPKPAVTYIALCKLVQRCFDGGWTQDDLGRVIREAHAFTSNAFDYWRKKTPAASANGKAATVAVADRALCADLGTCVRRYRHKGMTVFVEKHGPFPDRLWSLYDEMYPDPIYRVSVAPDGTVPS